MTDMNVMPTINYDYSPSDTTHVNGVKVPEGTMGVHVNGADGWVEFFDANGVSLGRFEFDKDAPTS